MCTPKCGRVDQGRCDGREKSSYRQGRYDVLYDVCSVQTDDRLTTTRDAADKLTSPDNSYGTHLAAPR
jgi:hypothetical protein